MAQAMPHETIPMIVLPTTKGPPLSPMHVPCPSRVNVQTVLSKIRAALTVLKRSRQSAFVKVFSAINCKRVAAEPGCEVCPHPVAMAETPPPTKMLFKLAGAMVAVVETVAVVSSNDTSLAKLLALYEG